MHYLSMLMLSCRIYQARSGTVRNTRTRNTRCTLPSPFCSAVPLFSFSPNPALTIHLHSLVFCMSSFLYFPNRACTYPMVAVKVAALLAGAGSAVAAVSFPATVDLTLVFPRNATYDASALLPIVFAFDNPEAVPLLQPDLWYTLWDASNDSASVANNRLVQPSTPISTNDSFFLAIDSLDQLVGKAGSWRLQWNLDTVNCSSSTEGSTTASTYLANSPIRSIYFTTTTDGSGAQPDIAAAATNTTCGTEAHANTIEFSISGTLTAGLSKPDGFDGTECAVQADSEDEYAVPSSCAVSLDDAAVASVSAAATQTACAASSPVVSCPAATSTAASSAASGLRFVASGSASIAAVAGLIVLAM
ncbi:hypothetical protein F503_07307 [Ophiostoma piceae UAMH 11346]|uniref:DUF7136 domain-containing protein n=1 Tax=Ophiostoma piceae (strain UAMH 11346) TaxID=1262450 RepID=S3CC27_OPHP1|nr:hypothetical protein F503_07307 [Ophiostoma piceae UAMH 11346]